MTEKITKEDIAILTHSIRSAIFDSVGMLDTLKPLTTYPENYSAEPIVDLIKDFLDEHDNIESPPIKEWNDLLTEAKDLLIKAKG